MSEPVQASSAKPPVNPVVSDGVIVPLLSTSRAFTVETHDSIISEIPSLSESRSR